MGINIIKSLNIILIKDINIDKPIAHIQKHDVVRDVKFSPLKEYLLLATYEPSTIDVKIF